MFKIARIHCFYISMAFASLMVNACFNQEPNPPDPDIPDPGSPALEAMSLVQIFNFRGGSAIIDTLDLSPRFNPDHLQYTANRGEPGWTIKVNVTAQSPNSDITATFKESVIPAIAEVERNLTFRFTLNWDTIETFKTTVRDPEKGTKRIYSVLFVE